DIGNVSALPSPYAKNNFAAEYTTSSSRIPSTSCANSSAVRIKLVCTCMVPFGLPVEPEEYSQKHVSSGRVGAASASGVARSVSAASVGCGPSYEPCGSDTTK